MKDTTKKTLIIACVFAAVLALVTAKHFVRQKHIEQLPDDSVVGKGKPVLLELGSHGCIPCNEMMPILIDLSKTQQAFVVSFVDVKAVEGKAEQYNINLIPTQLFFDAEGNELFRHTGFFSKEDILAKWQEFSIDVKLPL